MCRAMMFGLAALLVAGCGRTTPAAPSSPPTIPGAPSVPAAPPKAVLAVGVEGAIPILTVTNYELTFDASRSTGDGLTYLLEFGDGASSTQPFARHGSPLVTRRTARLTVTDRLGRTDSTAQDYFLAHVDNTGCGTGWYYSFPYRNGASPTLSLTLRQEGASISGTYRGLDLVRRTITGTISGDRGVTMRTTDGSIELNGGLVWNQPVGEYMSQYGVTLRLTIKGGDLDGQVFDFFWNDPF